MKWLAPFLLIGIVLISEATDIVALREKANQRSPASISTIEKLKLDCNTPEMPNHQVSHLVQMEGKICGRNYKIINHTNGFEASVITHGNEFITDMLQLNPGENKIEVTYLQGFRSVTKKFRLVSRASL
jgi:hypothetical protein